MNIKSIITKEDAIEFAKEEFARQGITWNCYEAEDVVEISSEVIAKFKLHHRQPGWLMNFVLRVPDGCEKKYIFLYIDTSLETCKFTSHA
jgi:hypothetical protein